jgi:DNA-binding transcriptional LysR family regulator
VTRQIELRHLQAFVAVADELHFTRAAERLHLAQQALSTQIRQLEDALRTRLFVRTTRSVQLTGAGEVLLSEVRPVLAALENAWEQTEKAGKGEIGTLTLAYTPTVAPETLPLLTEAMHAKHPSVSLKAYETWQADALAAVASGRLDLGFARCNGPFDDLSSMVVRHEQLGVVFGEGHPLSRDETVPLAGLADEVLTIWPRELSPDYYDLVVGFFGASGFHGGIREFENLNRDVFFGDPVARTEMAACRAFSVAFVTEQLPPGFVWRPVEPAPEVPLTLFWRSNAGEVTLSFVRVVEEVAASKHWNY